MTFDPNSQINKLCIQGMEQEATGNEAGAIKLFIQAWEDASDDFEKFTAAHYVARHQQTIIDKLKWDKLSLELAFKINNAQVKASLPSLYLNIGKGYEDLNDLASATVNYKLALSFVSFLPKNGYGKMIHSGVEAGLRRIGG